MHEGVVTGKGLQYVMVKKCNISVNILFLQYICMCMFFCFTLFRFYSFVNILRIYFNELPNTSFQMFLTKKLILE